MSITMTLALVMAATSLSPQEQLARIVDNGNQLWQARRGPYPIIAPALTALGPEAVPAMLDSLRGDVPARVVLRAEARHALRVSMLEALGRLRDERTRPYLTELLTSSERDHHTVRAAAGALGRLGSDADAELLITLHRQADAQRRAALLAGLGGCRRLIMARYLTTLLDPSADLVTARPLLRSLRSLAAGWAWQTPRLLARGEGLAVQRHVAQALVELYPPASAELRGEIAKAVLVVDYPDTPALIAATDNPALAQLRRHFERSPLHR